MNATGDSIKPFVDVARVEVVIVAHSFVGGSHPVIVTQYVFGEWNSRVTFGNIRQILHTSGRQCGFTRLERQTNMMAAGIVSIMIRDGAPMLQSGILMTESV